MDRFEKRIQTRRRGKMECRVSLAVEEDWVGDIVEASLDVKETWGGAQARAVSRINLVH